MELKILSRFIYLENNVTYDGNSTMDIKCRIAQRQQVFYKKNKLITANAIKMETK